MMRRLAMGMRLASDVLIERISTWFIETLTMSLYVARS